MYVKQNTGSLLRRLFCPSLLPASSLDHHHPLRCGELSRVHKGPVLPHARRLCPYSYRYLPLKSTVLNPQILQWTVSLRLPLLVYLMRLRAGIYAHV